MIIKAVVFGLAREAQVHAAGLVVAQAVLFGQRGMQVTAFVALPAGIQLKAAEAQADLIRPIKEGQGLFKAALADVAEGTHHVRPDIDDHHIEIFLSRLAAPFIVRCLHFTLLIPKATSRRNGLRGLRPLQPG